MNEESYEDPSTYRIYHASFQDFLDKEVGLKRFHETIALNALGKIPGVYSEHVINTTFAFDNKALIGALAELRFEAWGHLNQSALSPSRPDALVCYSREASLEQRLDLVGRHYPCLSV